MALDDFYQINNNNSNNLFLHMNISSVFYHNDDLNNFIMNCKNKLKVIGISECRIKASRPSLSNINMSNYSYEYTPTDRVLGKPYLMLLHVIFPIHLNFPVRARCVLKAIINRKK